ncbi:hypothetical protein IAT40_000303 [Kwoniella sp. CBS 6097]
MLLSTLLTTLFLPALTSAFSFSFDTTSPKQCGSTTVTWEGGSSPYSLTIIPAFDYPTTINIPDSAYDASSGKGSYTWRVNYPKDTRYVAMMSDNAGTGTGGVSTLFTVGANTTSCTLRRESADFQFYLNETSLTQCDTIDIYWDATAFSPVTVLGVIPGGQVFQLVSANANTQSLVWDTNVASGTEVIFAAFDHGPYGTGGSSALYNVGTSSDRSCLDDSSPSSTTQGGPTATGTKTGNVGGVKTVTAVTTQTAAPKGAAGLSTGAIVGIVVSAVIVVLSLQFALFWFCCRRQVKALIYHRREMRGAEVKPGGEVDLGLATRHSGFDEEEDPYADLAPAARQQSQSQSRSRYSASRSGDDQLDAASSVSPFFDNSAVGMKATPGNRPPTLGTLDTDFDLPRIGHARHDSFALSIGQSLHDLDLTPSPSLSAAGGFSPTSPLVPRLPNTASALPSPSGGGPSGAGAGPGAGGRQPHMTKAQMAAALSASNPDPPNGHRVGGQGRTGGGAVGEEFGARSPPQEAPSGGFRRHEDAGPIQRSGGGPGEDVEDLPPMYRPEWETSSQYESDRERERR